MPEITPDILILLASATAALLIGTPLIVSLITIFSLRTAAKDRKILKSELLAIVKKIEVLTSSPREQMLKHYDGLLEVLSSKLPTEVANHTGQLIFDTESKILARLAEIEPNLIKDDAGKEKLNELIKSMEALERTIVNLTSDAVRDVMVDGRRSLFEDPPTVVSQLLS